MLILLDLVGQKQIHSSTVSMELTLPRNQNQTRMQKKKWIQYVNILNGNIYNKILGKYKKLNLII